MAIITSWDKALLHGDVRDMLEPRLETIYITFTVVDVVGYTDCLMHLANYTSTFLVSYKSN